MIDRGVDARFDRVRFGIAAAGVCGLFALALVIRVSSPSGGPSPRPDGPHVAARLPASPAVSTPVAAGAQAAAAPAAAWQGPVPVTPARLPAGIALPTFTRVMSLPPVPSIEDRATCQERVPARRVGAGITAPVAFSRAVALPTGPAADTAAAHGVVGSAFTSAGRHVESGVRTVGRVFQRLF